MIYVLNSIFFLIPFFGYSAAYIASDNPSQSSAEELYNGLVGVSYNNNGAHGLITSITDDADPVYSIIITYSELPALKASSVLQNMAKYIYEQHIDYDSKKLKVLCAQEIAKHMTHESQYLDHITSINYELIALCIELRNDTIKNVMCTQHANDEPRDARCTYDLVDTLRYAVSNGHTPIPSTRTLGSCQALAKELQDMHPEEPFHLVIDFDAWRRHIKPKPDKKNKSKTLLSKQALPKCFLQ
jgi:hypothetical protein